MAGETGLMKVSVLVIFVVLPLRLVLVFFGLREGETVYAKTSSSIFADTFLVLFLGMVIFDIDRRCESMYGGHS